MRILFVNDEPSIHEIFEAMTSSIHETEFACDGNEALQKYGERGPYDLVLSDVMHPGPDGLELLSIILQRNPSQQTGLITNMAAPPRSGLLTSVPVLPMPFEKKELLAFLNTFHS